MLYRVRWKNYSSDDDTWEPEAHLDDCREVLLAYKKALAEIKPKIETGMVRLFKMCSHDCSFSKNLYGQCNIWFPCFVNTDLCFFVPRSCPQRVICSMPTQRVKAIKKNLKNHL